MKWRNVKLILARELRDQMRDRRTLFTVLVMPLLLYPLLGAALLQVSQFSREHPTKVWIVGSQHLPDSPPLISESTIHSNYLAAGGNTNVRVVLGADDQKILAVVADLMSTEAISQRRELVNQLMQQELELRDSDVAMLVCSEIDSHSDVAEEPSSLPSVMLFSNSARDKSTIAAQKLARVLERYKQALLEKNLSEKQIQPASLDSFQVVHSDVADEKWKQAATWSKILPFVVMIWCLTGAFYPAVDLCAGEKERGTFETLLSSPALRSEIAIGKLLTVTIFSIMTSLLNLLSMGFTGMFVVSRISAQMAGQQTSSVAALGMPPVSSLIWLILALIPIAALFSAVALAAASFAKSSKEGQYYLVPLMMISMPLMMLPMMPAAKLDLGSSLIPVSGLMLMLRGLIEGRYSDVLPFAGPVVAVTLVCCWLAIRWVVIQFSRESVIFVPSERFSVEVWLKQIIRERGDLPFVGQAILCGVLILVIKFFVSLGATVPTSFLHFTRQTLILLVASVGVPAVLMAMFLTRNPMKSLKISPCTMPVACAAILLAICLHPCIAWITQIVLTMYPPGGDLSFAEQIMSMVMSDAPGVWAILLVLALAPAIFEELAFRGFVLSGLQNLKNDAHAILLSALLFGAAHSILQQSIITFFVGCVLGFVAIRTNSLVPCVLYHFTHNSISTCMSMDWFSSGNGPISTWIYSQSTDGSVSYALVPAIVMSFLGVALLAWFWKLPRWEKAETRAENGGLDVSTFLKKSEAGSCSN